LSFRAEREHGDWRLEWDRDAVAKLDPVGAMLAITDGGIERSQFLSPEDLASGFMLYVPHNPELLFRLKISGKDGDVEEQFRILGATVPQVAETKVPEPRRERIYIPSGPRSSPEPVRMIAAAWPASVPRVVPVQVQVRVWVDANGRVIRTAPAEPGAARDRFVQSAMAAARSWSFTPARSARGAVPAETVLTFKFKP